ncbi:hypothetical protein Trydic_g5955 [Trypoxylus dichotomus]
MYPTDPYTIEDFHPAPMGELTNTGKNRAYSVGLTLRKTYDEFLGDYYSPQEVKAISSPFSRCMDSVVLMVNAIFPATGSQKWRYDVEWHPISYEYNSANDKIFLVYKHCPNFRTFQDERLNSEETKHAFEKLEDVIAYLRQKTGDFREKYVFAYKTYSTLLAETELGLTVPEWASTLFPETLADIAKVEVEQMYKGKNRVLGAAHFMQKLINDTILMLDDEPEVRGRKLYMYCGHDMNIIAILSWLDVYMAHLPNYGAYLVFEIHEVLNNHYIKILYENNDGRSAREIYIPHCGVICRFDEFIALYKHKLIADDLCG